MNRRLTAILFTAFILTVGLLPLAQAQVAVEQNLTDEQLWTDAMYFLKIGRMEYGKAYLQAYIERKVDPVKTLTFSEKDPRSVQILIRLQDTPDLGKLARAALDEIDKGWLLRRRDVVRIQAEIDRLTGTPRAQIEATQRLKEAGEYAVPVMLDNLANPERPALHAKIIDALVALGPSAVEPLLAAVTDLPESTKLLVLRALARLDYPQEVPYLKEVIADAKETQAVRSSARNALEQILTRNPKYRTDASAAGAFYDLAMRYYYHDSTVKPAGASTRVVGLSPDVAAEQPNVWLMAGGKLVPQPVPWEIYYELMTMRMTRRSLQLDTTAGPRAALTLWLMADARRESRLSATVADPLHAKEFPDIQYFLRSAGTRYSLDALARGQVDGDLAIMVDTLEALREVASGNDILATFNDAQPIAGALNHGHQLVQLYAALALGWTAPADKYPGMDQVVPLLGQALTGPKNPAAILIVPNAQRREALAGAAKSLGFDARPAGNYDTGSKLMTQDPANVELIVIDYALTTPTADQVINRIRGNTFLKFVPIIVLVTQDRLADANTVIGRMPGVAVIPESAAPETMTGRVEYLRKQLGRITMTKEEVTKNALLAANALERLAQARLAQYNVEQAREKLAQALAGTDWTLGREAARVLALLSSDVAQRSLADGALTRKDAGQKVILLNLLAESVRRSGNKLAAGQVTALQDLVIAEADPAIRQATAKVLGALNLPPAVARKVVLAREPFGGTK